MSETRTDAPAAQAPLEAAGAVKQKIPGKGWPVFGWKVTRWSTLRALGNSPLARATIVIPVVGYLLIMNGEFVAWFDPDAAAVHASGVPLLFTHAWRLIFIYYGLTLTALATAWYGLACPKLIKKYA